MYACMHETWPQCVRYVYMRTKYLPTYEQTHINTYALNTYMHAYTYIYIYTYAYTKGSPSQLSIESKCC